MTPEIFEKQSQVHALFGALRVLEEVEWIDAISDDHNPNMCPCCGGFQTSRYGQENVGHKADCGLRAAKLDIFHQAVGIASSLPDGNLFINLVTALHLARPKPTFG